MEQDINDTGNFLMPILDLLVSIVPLIFMFVLTGLLSLAGGIIWVIMLFHVINKIKYEYTTTVLRN